MQLVRVLLSYDKFLGFLCIYDIIKFFKGTQGGKVVNLLLGQKSCNLRGTSVNPMNSRVKFVVNNNLIK